MQGRRVQCVSVSSPGVVTFRVYLNLFLDVTCVQRFSVQVSLKRLSLVRIYRPLYIGRFMMFLTLSSTVWSS